MNIVLSGSEQKAKEWQFKDTDNNLEFTNNIVVTNKRFIYQKELTSSSSQKSVSRYDIPLENIKSAESFYGVRRGLLWLICGIVGIFLALFSILPLATEEVGMGIFLMVFGLAFAGCGFFFHINPDKSPVKIKNPNFTLVLETKNSNGASFFLGAGKGLALRGKSAVNPAIFVLLLLMGIWPAFVYYFAKKKGSKSGLELPENVAIEIVETIGSLIF